DITIIDSKITSIPAGYMVMEAAKSVKEGKNKDEVINIYKNVFNVKEGGTVIIGHSDNIEDAKDIEKKAKEAF
ncbi:unnamed protein product, partial [marine sediment metagenome]